MNLLTTLNLALQAFIAGATAYAKKLERETANELDQLEDEIDNLASLGTPIAKLRVEALSQRLERKRECAARSGDNPPP